MKFCFVDRANAHSIWSLIDIISIELIKRGDEVLYCKLLEDGATYARQVPDGVQLELIQVPAKKNPLDLLRQIYKFSIRFKKLISTVDVLHTNFVYPGALAKYLAKSEASVIITTQHEVYHSMNFHWRVILNLTQKYTDSIVYISNEVRRSFKSVSKPKCDQVVIKNGVNLDYLIEIGEKYRPESKSMNVVCVGRLVPEKGQATLIEAWPTVLKHAPKANLFLLGAGPDEKKLKARCAELNIINNVEFLGWLSKSDTIEEIAKSNIIVVPSQHEGFGLVVTEAMAVRTPIICSNIPVFRELANDTVNYFEPNNHSELAEIILVALKNKISETKLTRAQNRVAKYFDETNMVAQYIKLYDNQLKAKGLL